MTSRSSVVEATKGSHRGVLVGYGSIAQGHLAGYARTEQLSVGAVVDPSPARRRASQHDLPGVPVFESVYEAMSIGEFDFVDVCAPPNAHLELIEFCVRRGTPVLCEKPLLTSASELSHLLALLSDRSLLHPSHNYLYAPGITALRSAVAELDEPIDAIRLATDRVGHARGVREWHPHWRRDSEVSGGGMLSDHGPHSIYIACDLLDAYPEAVTCSVEEQRFDRWAPTEDIVRLDLHFASVDVRIDLTWRAPRRSTTYEVLAGGVRLALLNDVLYREVDGQTATTSVRSDFDDPTHGMWFETVLAEFADCISSGRPSPHLADALVSVAVIDAAYESARRNRRVAVSPAAIGLTGLWNRCDGLTSQTRPTESASDS